MRETAEMSTYSWQIDPAGTLGFVPGSDAEGREHWGQQHPAECRPSKLRDSLDHQDPRRPYAFAEAYRPRQGHLVGLGYEAYRRP